MEQIEVVSERTENIRPFPAEPTRYLELETAHISYCFIMSKLI